MTAGSEERIDIGADVIGRGGDKVGTVAYVVVRPPQLHVTDIVVSTGAILGRDIVVPVAEVQRVAEGKVYLTVDKDGLDRYPDYVEIDYKAPPEEWVPMTGFYYPAQATLWPADQYYPQVSSVNVNAPPGTVGLHEGMDVESSDGHKVGSIVSLDTDPASEDVTGIVVKHGLVFSHDTFIPAQYVTEVTGDRVRLSLTGNEVKERLEGRRPGS